MKTKLEAKLKKLFALAERGIGGEKRNANNMLLALLQKYRLTIKDIESDKRELHWFRWRNIHEQHLLYQIFYATLEKYEMGLLNKDRPKQSGVSITVTERLEIQIQYDGYKKDLKKGLDLYVEAFIQKNEIFPKAKADNKPERELRVQEKERNEQIRRMMWGMNKTSIRKQIENGK